MGFSAYEDRVRVDYHQFYIAGPDRPEDFVRAADPFANGLLGTTPGAAVILTGISMGPVNVRLELHDETPAASSERWDVVMEADFESDTEPARVSCWGADGPHNLPVVDFAGPGIYGLRVYTRGRDVAYDLVVREPTEDYLIQVWFLEAFDDGQPFGEWPGLGVCKVQ